MATMLEHVSAGIVAPIVHVRALECPPHLFDDLLTEHDWRREWEETRGRLIVPRRRIRRTLSIDGGIPTGTAGSASSSVTASSSLVTSLTNDIVIVCVVYENTGGTTPSVSAITNTGSALTFTQRTSFAGANNSNIIDTWWAKATSTISTIITANFSISIDAAVIAVFAVNGANLTTPFDPNGSLPATNSHAAVPASTANATLSTSNANDLLFGISTQNQNQTAGSGYSLQVNNVNVSGTNDAASLSLETNIVSSVISSGNQSYGTATQAISWNAVFDAIQAPISLQGGQSLFFM